MKLSKSFLSAAVLALASLNVLPSHAEVSRSVPVAAANAVRQRPTPEEIESAKQRALARVAEFEKMRDAAMAEAHSAVHSNVTSGQVMRIVAGQLPTFGGESISQLQFSQPGGVVLDSSGNVYVADSALCTILKVSGGNTTLFAGNGACGYSGDGGPASSAQTGFIVGIAINGGYLYYGDNNASVIRRVNLSTNIITRYAGTPNVVGATGDGGAATSATLGAIFSFAFDASGNLYLADSSNGVVREVLTNGNITTVAGVNLSNGATQCSSGGTDGFGDGCAATQATMYPYGVAVSGNSLYIGDALDVIRVVNLTTGIITVYAGQIENNGDSGDGGAATSATVGIPASMTFDSAGNLYFVDANFSVIRKITSGQIISTVTGQPGTYGYGGDNGPATAATLNLGVTSEITAIGTTLAIADSGNNRVRAITNVASGTGTISTLAGNGFANYYGNGGVATSAGLVNPAQLGEDAQGNLYIADSSNYAIRKVNTTTGIISTIAGTGLSYGASTANGVAGTASNIEPDTLLVDAAGDCYFVDGLTSSLRKYTASTGLLSTIASTIPVGTSGATIGFYQYGNMTFDSTGANIYLTSSNLVAEVNIASGTVTVIANTANTRGYSGDSGAATAATLKRPNNVALDAKGDLIVADQGNNVLRSINLSSGIISTIAGTAGDYGDTGDGNPAIDATFGNIEAMTTDAAGDIFIGDTGFSVVREISAATGDINTIIGTGTEGYTGNKLAPLSTEMSPDGFFADSSGNLLISDFGNELVWLDTTVPQAVTNTLTSSTTTVGVGGSVTLTATLTGKNFFGQYPSGTVAFKSGSSTFSSVAPVNGVATLTINSSSLPLGTYPIDAVYSGDGTYGAATSNSITLTVKSAATITVTASPTTLKQNSGTTVSLSSTVTQASGSVVPTGTVTFSVNGTAVKTATLASGVATYSLASTGLAPGTYTITASYSGDANYAPASTTSSATVTVTPLVYTTATTLTAMPLTVTQGTNVTLAATVAETNGSATPTGTVTFKVNGATFQSATLSAGTASLTLPTSSLAAGTYSVTASYGGDSTDSTSTSGTVSVTVNSAVVATTTTLVPTPSSVTVGSPIRLAATVAKTSGSGTPTGTVTYKLNGTSFGTATLSGGVATLSLSTTGFTPGTYSITASYGGDSLDSASTSSAASVTVVSNVSATSIALTFNPTTVKSGTSSVLTAVVSKTSGTGTPTGTVTFSYNGTTLSTVTLSNGSASYTVPTTGFAAGNYVLTAKYNGDTYDTASTQTATLTVTPATAVTTTAVTLNPNPVTQGATTVLTVTVTATTGPAATSGSVTLYLNGEEFGSGSIGANSTLVMSYPTTSFPVGNYSIYAAYAGTTGFAASTSPTVTLTVNPAP